MPTLHTLAVVLNLQFLLRISVNYNSPAHFGNGTKLTVLDPDIEISTGNVTILTPSTEENCKQTVTLVCVAENFYPDHVRMIWKVRDKELSEGVATDPHATKQDTGMFAISSRLKVSKKEWNNEKNEFTCIFYFYNGTKEIASTSNVKRIAESGYSREEYVHSSQMIKMSYGMFIAKSALYGLVIFVYVLIKRVQESE